MYAKTIIVGRLGKDPETRNLENGNTVASFSVATSEAYKNKDGERVEDTEWYNVQMWGKLADIAGKYLSKGSLVVIEGKLKTRSWEKDGDTRYATELVAKELKMLGGDTNKVNKPKKENADRDDLPF